MAKTVASFSSAEPRRPLFYLRVVYGTALLLATDSYEGQSSARRPDRTVRAFARMLGLRQLAEAMLLARHRRSDRWLLAGAAVDAVHAVTVAVIAAHSERRRGLALLNFATASALAAEGLRERRVGIGTA